MAESRWFASELRLQVSGRFPLSSSFRLAKVVFLRQTQLRRYGDADFFVNPAITITNIIALLLPTVLADAG
ncbi:hypothetical protein MMSR116_00580 [Methylobacterium mesophilicum SR1.6/6]|uniref:Uncharacterized protein n=1 Tax=Methylobacterium mesophilicum SR1.6/6 TaxID=908290 RepID=A0A6B9FHI1_9HYPH|nr:hypothetical protein [Methylobacterium mesophilicum]QGY00574.1 hypothetical protein MMSR116_00580 [Methylobacterium mesophilicum SR1.6/6]